MGGGGAGDQKRRAGVCLFFAAHVALHANLIPGRPYAWLPAHGKSALVHIACGKHTQARTHTPTHTYAHTHTVNLCPQTTEQSGVL